MSGSKGGSKAPGLPKPEELKPLLELQNQYNRVGVENPFGSQNYRRNPDGTSTLVTDIGQDGQNMIRRAGTLGMTDSAMVQGNPQLDAMAGALAGRVGSRLGLQGGGSPIGLVQQPTRPQKPQTATPPTNGTGLPPPPTDPTTTPTTQPPGTNPNGPPWRNPYLYGRNTIREDLGDHYLQDR